MMRRFSLLVRMLAAASVACWAVLSVSAPAFAATYNFACENGCTSKGGYLNIGGCSSSETAVTGYSCKDNDSGKYAFCCVPKTGKTCSSVGGTCLSPTTCTAEDKSTETGFAYKIISDGVCPTSPDWCCQKLPPRPGYVADSYDEATCTGKLNGSCAISCGSFETNVGSCGVKGGVSYVCCADKVATTPSASTDAAKTSAAGGSASGTTAAPVEKPLVTAATYGYTPPLGKDVTVNQLIGRIIRALSPAVGVLFLIMFIWGGFTWLSAGGDAKKVQQARQILLSAVIGMLIVLTAYIVVFNVIAGLGTAVAP